MEHWRLGFHLMPPQGWLNDPNGLCQDGEWYHVFFQYSPENTEGGDKVWGHYRSKDMIRWEFTGITMNMDTAYETHGCYSGSAIVEDGKLHIFYTGNVKEEGEHDYINSGRRANTIYAVSPDGVQVESKKLVLSNGNYPSNCTCHVRDPKVWKEDDMYYMVQGARKKDDTGCVLVFRAPDKVQWSYVKSIQKDNMGYMWECPDYFRLDGLGVLSVSPQGMEKEEYRFQNIYQSGYFLFGRELMDVEVLGEFHEWDMGFDFYAPQTFLDNKGRRILIGWMGIPDADYTNPTVQDGWQHCLTVPRELTIEEGVLYQQPVKELEQLRTNERNYVGDWKDTELHGRFELVTEHFREITIASGVHINWDEKERVLSLKLDDAVGFGRRERKVKLEKLEDIRILADTSALEIYVNQGSTVMSTRFYGSFKAVTIETKGTQITKLWSLKKMEVIG